MKARGKREARRPWFIQYASFRPEGPKYARYYALSGLGAFRFVYQGRRASRFALNPGFISRAFGAAYVYCGSGWVNHQNSKSIVISHARHRPTRYRRWY